MTFRPLILAAALLISPVASAVAEQSDEKAGWDKDRYSVTKLDNGYLRLDRKTGDLSHCVIDNHDAWNCVIVPETRQRYERRIKELTKENDYLKARQKAMETRLIEVEETLFDLRDQLAETEKRVGEDKKPFFSREERKRLDKALDTADSMLNRFSTMMKGLKDDAEDFVRKLPKKPEEKSE